MDTIPELRAILRDCHTLAVVGLSAEWHRPGFFAARYMPAHGYRIVPVSPRYAASGTDILGERCCAEPAYIPFPVDMVDMFRRAEDVLPIAQEAVRIGARCLWQQIGVKNVEANALPTSMA
jgi:predicted CoA-binding protein